MWAEAAKWLGKFDETVMTALDANGYPVSIRVDLATKTPRRQVGCAASVSLAHRRGSG